MDALGGTHGRPTLDEVLDSLRVVSIGMRVPFRGLTHREVALIRGPSGWGEFSPFVEYGPGEAAAWLACAIEAAFSRWPDPVRDEVPVNATVPAVAAADVADVLAAFEGCDTAKVKVAQAGQSVRDDLDRVAAVRDVLGARARIRVDANGAWSLDEARAALAALAPYDLEYAEQPCADVEDLARLRVALARDGVGVRVAADESIRRAADPYRVRDLGAADVIVVKVAPLGGVAAALRLVGEVGLPAVVSSALDSSVGIRAGVALAAALPDLTFACGLATVALLSDDVSDEPMLPAAGRLPVRDVPVSAERLDRLAAAPDRELWWRRRIEAAWPHLPGPRGA